MGSGAVFERCAEIKYSLFLDRLTIRVISTDDPCMPGQLTYTGRISSRQGMVRYISLRDTASHERLTWYIFDPFFDEIEKTVGLYIALDLKGLPAAGPLMMSRNMLPLEEAEKQLENCVLRVEPLVNWIPSGSS